MQIFFTLFLICFSIYFLDANILKAQSGKDNYPTPLLKTMAYDSTLLDTCGCNNLEARYKIWKAQGSKGGFPTGFNSYIDSWIPWCRYTKPPQMDSASGYYNLCLKATNTDASNAEADTFANYWNTKSTEQIEFFAMNFAIYIPEELSCSGDTTGITIKGGSSSLNFIPQSEYWSIYPNPVNPGSQIVLSGTTHHNPTFIQLFDLQSRPIAIEIWKMNNKSYIKTPAELSSGVYILTVRSQNKSQNIKLIIR